jgi:hypothetical protein
VCADRLDCGLRLVTPAGIVDDDRKTIGRKALGHRGSNGTGGAGDNRALSYHEITTQIPSSVHLAVPRGSYYRVKLPMAQKRPVQETPAPAARTSTLLGERCRRSYRCSRIDDAEVARRRAR